MVHKALKRKLKNPGFMGELMRSGEMSGHSDEAGRVTFNKDIVNKKSFGYFADVITSIVPMDVVVDADRNGKLPSLARVLGQTVGNRKIVVYKRYLYMNATMEEEYMDYEDEEDQEAMDDLLETVNESGGGAVIGITVQKSEAMGSAHASAFVAWKVKKGYRFAYYDPLAYKRGSKSYDFADRAFRSERFVQRIEFINLNQYCFKKEKGAEDFHCAQYVMNAEYCYVYALFFLHLWMLQGGKLHRASFRRAIRATYVVDPSKLSRADTYESMVYRVTLMAFVCGAFLKYLRGLSKGQKELIGGVGSVDANVGRIVDYLREFRERWGFSLVKHVRLG